jgi:low affinity Fe/Cu permease
VKEFFRRFAHATARAVGSVWAFFLAFLVILVWAVSGPLFHFSDTWQLVINTGTTIITFIMVFLIQATQNRDSREIHLKLDELLRAISKARTGLAALDELSDDELDGLLEDFHRAREKKGLPKLVEEEIADEEAAEEASEDDDGESEDDESEDDESEEEDDDGGEGR